MPPPPPPPSAKVRTIARAALDWGVPAERAAYLDRACDGDAALRAEVEALLQANPPPPPPPPPTEMAPPAPVIAATASDTTWPDDLPRPPAPGVKIGKYKLLEELGEGGCGVVFMAEQLEPVRRRVAVKIIRLGMDTQQVIARFEAERQALAVMDHPNIAKVLDAGATETGRPYFVMELIRGVPLTRFCDENHLGVPERVKLFIQVCSAVQHAHQKGIIHRDLKPSNVLVTLHDGVPVPKVIDFGIAKATQQPLTARTLYTAHLEFIGTPAYMSPEQAELSGLDIDTRSDIYSLGVMLYELLTGQTPFPAEDLAQAGLDEMRRRIREVEPPTAATRLRTLAGAELANAARRRGTTAPKLISLVRGDLDWIAMKCLEKDRTRRYESAANLAHDLQRYLDHEPVAAGPPSTLYRLRKFARRHQPALATAAVFVVVLLGATVISLREARRADREAAEAVAQRQTAEAQRALAERNSAEVKRQQQAVVVAYNRADFNAALDRLGADNPNEALAYLVRALGAVPDNRAAAGLLHSILLQGGWLLPLAHFSAPEAGAVLDVASDGRTVITGGPGANARVWDLATSQPLTPPLPGSAPVGLVRFSPDGRRALTVEQPGSRGRGGPGGEPAARIWNAASGQLVAPLAQPLGAQPSANFTAGGGRLLTAGGRGARGNFARLWDAGTGQLLGETPPQAERVLAANFSPDGRRFVAVSGNSARVFDAATREPLGAPLTHEGRVTAAVFSPDGRQVATASLDQTAHVWDTATSQAVGEPMKHEAAVADVAFSPDGQRVATASQDKTARVWSAATGAPVSVPLWHESAVTTVVFSPDGARVATSAGEMARLWEAAGGRAISPPLRHESPLRAVLFSPDGGRLIAVGQGAFVRIWNTASPALPPATVALAGWRAPGENFPGARRNGFPGGGRGDPGNDPAAAPSRRGPSPRPGGRGGPGGAFPREWAFNPEGTRLATLAGRSVQIWNTATGQPVTAPITGNEPVFAVAFSPDGRQILTAAGASAQIWDAATGQPAGAPFAHEAALEFAIFSRDGRRVATGAQDRTVRIWDAATGQAVGEPLRLEERAALAAFSPDGRLLAAAQENGVVRLWEIPGGQLLEVLLAHEAPVVSLEFSPDGTRLLTAAGLAARVWDAATGRPLSAPMRPGGQVAVATFDAAGRRVLTAAEAPADTLQVWDAATGQAVALPMTWSGPGAGAVTFSADGQSATVATRDGELRTWPVADTPVPPWLLALAETLAQTRLDATGAPVYYPGAPLDILRRQAAQSPAADSPAVRWAQALLEAKAPAP